MNHNLNKKSILRKTFQVGSLTFLSRVLGIIREMLQVQYFGIGAISDAFITAFKIPNFFRHIFAEGALSASFVPAIVGAVKKERHEEANGLMTISFIFFEGIIFLIYLFVLFRADLVINFIAPGFSAEQAAHAIPFLKIMFPFLLFVSSSALLGGALQSVNHFFAPAFAPALWNMVYVSALLIALHLTLPPAFLCFGVLAGGLAWLGLHLFFFFRNGFHFGIITSSVIQAFRNVLKKFLPCLFGVSIMEINLFIGGMVASYLPKGSVSLLYYGSRFMNIPLGIFAVALSSILLPHFSRMVLYAPKRLSFYLLEVTKFVTWVILPATLVFIFVSHHFFAYILLGNKATDVQITQATGTLMIYLIGLLVFCLNKILLSLFYSVRDTWATTFTSGASALVNLLGDVIALFTFGIYGIAASTVVAGTTMTLLCFYFLKRRHNIKFYAGNYGNFLIRYLMQVALGVAIFYYGFVVLQHAAVGSSWERFFAIGAGYWVIVGLLSVAIMGLMFLTRKIFGVRVYFLDR